MARKGYVILFIDDPLVLPRTRIRGTSEQRELFAVIVDWQQQLGDVDPITARKHADRVGCTGVTVRHKTKW